MITSEFNKTYRTQIGDTVYTITSECDEDTTEDIRNVMLHIMKCSTDREERMNDIF